MQEQRIVTLEYVVGEDESQQLNFVQDDDGDWSCDLSEDEMNRILIAAYRDGKLDDEQ